jgi:hypothetical protein
MKLLDEIYNRISFEDTLKFFNYKYKNQASDKELLIEPYQIFIYYFTSDRAGLQAGITFYDLLELVYTYDNSSIENILNHLTYIINDKNFKPEYTEELCFFFDEVYNKASFVSDEKIIQYSVKHVFYNLKHIMSNTDKEIIRYFIDFVFKYNKEFNTIYNEQNFDMFEFTTDKFIKKLEFNKDIFCAIYQMFLSDGYVNKYIIDNNYFEQLCLNLSISELEKLLNIMEFDEFTTDFIKTLINNKYYELKKILKTDFHYSDEAIEKYFKSC